ncbi:MAG: FHA domain-containing protein [Thermoleophilaceae bacterium]
MADLILEIVEGGEAGRQLPLTGAVDIGRDPSLQLALEDTQISRRHARVSIQNNQPVVEDLGSTNGTYVNDQPIQAPRALAPGDRVRVGLTVLLLRDSQQVARQPSAVQPSPQLTAVGQDVLQPATAQELAPPVAAAPGVPQFGVEETEPAFVPPEVVEDIEAQSDYAAVQRLVDTRVKRQTNIAVFALLGGAGLAVLLVFGLQ